MAANYVIYYDAPAIGVFRNHLWDCSLVESGGQQQLILITIFSIIRKIPHRISASSVLC